MTVPVAFETYGDGSVYLHGTKASLVPGDLLTVGFASNFEAKRVSRHVYVTRTLDAATWGAELAAGDGPGHIYIVEPLGEVEDDPNVTNKRFPGNPTQSYRTRDAVRVVAELEDWVGHPAEQVAAMRAGLAARAAAGDAVIDD